MIYKKDDILKQDNYYRKILAVIPDSEVVVASFSWSDDDTEAYKQEQMNTAMGTYHTAELERNGWVKVEEPWKPQNGDSYYFVNEGGDVSDTNYYDTYSTDRRRVRCGNCFKTEDEAQAAAERVKKALKDQPL